MIETNKAYKVKTHTERKWILDKMHLEGYEDSYNSTLFNRNYDYYIATEDKKIIPLFDIGLEFKENRLIYVSDIIDIKLITVAIDEFVEVCICNGYKSMSIDFSNGSVSVLVGDKRVEASELGYEVKI